MKQKLAIGIFVLLVLQLTGLRAQTFLAGETYFSKDNYIEYQAGNVPLILSVPHGGRLEPSELPDRDCLDCVYAMDTYTQELARKIREEYFRQTGCYPHVVYNLLHRKKLDMNRDSIEAADSNSKTGEYWLAYHDFINAAKTTIIQTFGKGLFIDLHGHAHTKQRIEYGYLLYGSQLREADSVLNTAKRVSVSSIRNLVPNNLQNISHAELLRGSQALGTLFADRGFPGVPSRQDQFPLADDDYFNGGYNTLVHGSRTSGTMDAIQMELYSAIRYNTTQRAAFAEEFVTILRQYLQTHYVINFAQERYQTASVTNDLTYAYSVYPNPVSTSLTIDAAPFGSGLYSIVFVNMYGQQTEVFHATSLPNHIDVSNLAPGVYVVRLLNMAGRCVHNGLIIIAHQ